MRIETGTRMGVTTLDASDKRKSREGAPLPLNLSPLRVLVTCRRCRERCSTRGSMPLSRVLALEWSSQSKERQRESGTWKVISNGQIRLQLFSSFAESGRKKTLFFFFPPLFSMLARRASSYFSFRMGASLSTTYTSSGIEAAEAVAGREAIATTKATTSTSQSTAPSTSPAASTSSASTAPKPLAPPVEPCPEACCQSGCAECVWEVYYRERREYERALAEQQQRGSGGGREPAAGAAAASASPPPPPLDAFAALEAKVAAQEAEKARNRAGEAKS